MADPIVFKGTVEWTGENPGISLKEKPEGPFVTLASFFRVIMSPHGRGHALVLLQSPQNAQPAPDKPNVCYTDNENLARYLVANFLSKFVQYRGLESVTTMVYRKLDSVESSGDPASTYSETVKAGSTTVRMTWSGLGEPFCFTLPPEKSATGLHYILLQCLHFRDIYVTR